MKKENLYKLTGEAGWPYANSQYWKKGDYLIHYRVDEAKGKEKAKMLMIHGFACNTALFDELVAIYTKAGIKCVRIDLPDFGYSTKQTKGINYIPQTQLVEEMMAEMDPDNTGWILLGHSMGGSVSLEMKLETNAKINAIILNTPMFMANVPKFLGQMMLAKPMCAIMDSAIAAICDIDVFFKLAILIMTWNPIYTLKFETDRISGPFKTEKSGSGLCYMTSLAHCPNIENIKDFDIPVQLVTGSMDMFVMPSVKANLIKHLPNTTDCRNIVTGGHCLMQDKADKAGKWGLEFLKKNGLI